MSARTVDPQQPAAGGRAAIRRYQIQGREVTLPCIVRDAASGAATFLVSASEARKIVPPAFEVAEVWPGRTPFSIAVIDYRDNDLGDYNEVSLTFFVRPRGESAGLPYLGSIADFFRQRLGTWIYALPVDQSFTCEAGRTIWGFPKTVERIDMERDAGRCLCRLEMGGEHVLTLSLPRGGARSLPDSAMTTYTLIEGVPHRTRSMMGGDGVGFSGGRHVQLELGPHPVAQTLRRLGLPRRAIMAMWNEHMRGTFEVPEKL